MTVVSHDQNISELAGGRLFARILRSEHEQYNPGNKRMLGNTGACQYQPCSQGPRDTRAFPESSSDLCPLSDKGYRLHAERLLGPHYRCLGNYKIGAGTNDSPIGQMHKLLLIERDAQNAKSPVCSGSRAGTLLLSPWWRSNVKEAKLHEPL